MFCLNCGKELPQEALFCGSCGQKVGAASPASAPQTQQNFDFLNSKLRVTYIPRFGRSSVANLTFSTNEIRCGILLLCFIPISRRLDVVISYQDIERVEYGSLFGTVNSIIIHTKKDKHKFTFNKHMLGKIPNVVDFINNQL